MPKLRVGVLFGGRSGEHEVSLLSAASVLKAINPRKYEITPIGITKEGRWVTSTDATRLLNGEPASPPRALRAGDPDTTPSAAVLARGESVIVPPVPSETKTGALVPFETDAHSLDLHASYDLPVPQGAKVRPKLLIDVFNVGSPRQALLYDQVHYVDAGKSVANPTYGAVTKYQPPMSARVGTVVDF